MSKRSIENKKISKILIVNRGEIAVRIIKTAKKLGIATVAVYSNTDANAMFVEMADEKIALDGDFSKDTYINTSKILAAIKQSGADAVHPGYGFLSENEVFVQLMQDNGIIFIGPSASSIEAMGDKITAKKKAVEAGVSVVPGFMGIIEDIGVLKQEVEKIGFPVIIKATAGGGGKGMKIVYHDSELEDAVTSARNEARNSFGDERVFIEKYIECPRHIEIQVLADKHGNVVCLGERECSIQRFNQKVIEESPSPFLDEETRKKMYAQSVQLAKSCGYFSAGTVEYIVDKNRNFYFLEMNTRLQVEHPVTEYVTGLDLVEQMIRIAEGEKLNFSQADVKITGWAMESRICAEDPSKNFLPSVGRITTYIEPHKKRNVRVDTGCRQGADISPFYDSMVAKLITFGDTRKEAIAEMRRALSQYHIEGISTNIPMIEAIMRHEDFCNGDFSTHFIKQNYPKGFKGLAVDDDITRNLLLSSIASYIIKEEKYKTLSSPLNTVKDNSTIFDTNKLVATIDDKKYQVNIINYDILSGEFAINYEGQEYSYNCTYKSGGKVITIIHQNEIISIKTKSMSNGQTAMSLFGVTVPVAVYPMHIAMLLDHMPKTRSSIVLDKLIAPISGLLTKIKVENDQLISEGQDLIVIEAMKMENVIRADFDVKIKKICKKEGDIVVVGDTILEYYNSNV
jgi:propionyl-CoA carboxylase alpha chain